MFFENKTNTWEIKSLMFQRCYIRKKLKWNAKNGDDLWKLNVKYKFLKVECFKCKFFQSEMHTWEKWNEFWKSNVKWKLSKIKCIDWKFFQSKMQRWEMESLMFQLSYLKKKVKMQC